MTEYQNKCEAIVKARNILICAGLPVTAAAVSCGYTEAVERQGSRDLGRMPGAGSYKYPEGTNKEKPSEEVR